MILLVCPTCKHTSRNVQATMTIIATGWLQIIPGGNNGIEQAVSPPVRRESSVPPHILPTEAFICPRCGQETAVASWKYTIVCDQCENEIKAALKNPNRVVNAHICRDTRSIYCDECWKRVNRNYCGECRFHTECPWYDH